MLECANFDQNYTFTNKRYQSNWLSKVGSKCVSHGDRSIISMPFTRIFPVMGNVLTSMLSWYVSLLTKVTECHFKIDG